ncbi:unnamed protein product, partial [Meganyctiphanes norvegica]
NYLHRPTFFSNMDIQGNLLEESLMKLLEPCTTPEAALQLFSSPCFSPSAVYTRGNNEPAVIFLSYFKFMMAKLPNACIDGIWEDILNKDVMYTQHLIDFDPQVTLIMKLKHMLTCDCFIWLQEALSSYSKCPNPYIRLKLFRIIRLFHCNATSLNWEPVCDIFIHTLSEIKPHHLYPSGDEDESLLSVDDLTIIIYKKDITNIISTDIISQIRNIKRVFGDSKEARFMTHYIQLIGIFSILAHSIPDPFKYKDEIRRCYGAFRDFMDELVYCTNYDPLRYPNKRFRYVVSYPSFRHCATQTVCDLMVIFINMKVIEGYEARSLQFLCDVAVDLGVCKKTRVCEVPRLLLYRQIHGSTLARQHTLLIPLLLKNISPHYSFRDKSEEDENYPTLLSEEDGDYLYEDSEDTDSYEDSDSHQNSDSIDDIDSYDHSD